VNLTRYGKGALLRKAFSALIIGKEKISDTVLKIGLMRVLRLNNFPINTMLESNERNIIFATEFGKGNDLSSSRISGKNRFEPVAGSFLLGEFSDALRIQVIKQRGEK